MHPATGKTENYQDPSLGLDTVFVCKDGSEDVSLTVGEGRLNRFEDVRDISFKCCEWNLVQLDTSRARFLQSSDHLTNSRDEETGLNVSKYLKDIPTMTQISVSIDQDAFGKNSLLADKRNLDPGTVTAV